MVAKLSQLLAQDCIDFEKRVGNWSKSVKQKLERVHRVVGQRWRAEAVKRVPVDTGRLKQGILSNAYPDSQFIFVTEVGTNIEEYPLYLEFGTRFIAGGAVLRLGLSTTIDDTQAIHNWPAKDAEAIVDQTSYTIDSQGRRRTKTGQFVRNDRSVQEQMPWLRPAFNSIKIWVVDQLNGALEIPPP